MTAGDLGLTITRLALLMVNLSRPSVKHCAASLEATMATEPTTTSPITRRLSDISFEASDPEECAQWLRSIGYVDLPRRGPSEHARLRIGQYGVGGTCVVFKSCLVVCVPAGREVR